MHMPADGVTAPNEALSRALRGCLDDLDGLADRFVAEVQQLEPYRRVPEAELRSDAERSIELVLRTLGGMPTPKRLDGAWEQIGRQRARASIPSAVLLRAIRLDFRIIWSGMRARIPEDEIEALADYTVHISDVIEEHSARIHQAYIEEAALLARADENERTRLVDALLATDGRDSEVVTQVATALNMDTDARFVVAAAPAARARKLIHAATVLKAQAVPTHLQDIERSVVLIVQLPSRDARPGVRWFAGVPCVVTPAVCGIVALPASIRIGIEMAQTLTAAAVGPEHAADCWAAVAARRLPELTAALRTEVLPDPQQVTSHELDRVLETVSVFLRLGSVTEVADELFCHRNTVQNRLRRFTQLTGKDLTRPVDSAAVILALA